MKSHVAYLNYVLRHKWFVLLAGLQLGVPLWRLLIHDWTKFTPAEWGPYVRNFFNPDGSRRQGQAKTLEFELAWLHHQRNKHHWEAWVIVGHNYVLNPLPMPETYVREMVADWIGAGRANGQNDVHGWFRQNRSKMTLHPLTAEYIEKVLKKV